MKTYEQLTGPMKTKAREKCLNDILRAVVEVPDMFGPEIEEKVRAAFAEAERMQTPWFVGEYIMDKCADELKELAREEAEASLYSEPGERVINDIVT